MRMIILMEAQNQRAMRAYEYPDGGAKPEGDACVRLSLEAQKQRAMRAYDYPGGGAKPEGNACV